MGCDYYVQKSIHIEYIDTETGELHEKIIRNPASKEYLYLPDYEILDNTYEMVFKKFDIELKRRILKCTYIEKLYEHGQWISETYKNQYNHILTNNDTLQIIQI